MTRERTSSLEGKLFTAAAVSGFIAIASKPLTDLVNALPQDYLSACTTALGGAVGSFLGKQITKYESRQGPVIRMGPPRTIGDYVKEGAVAGALIGYALGNVTEHVIEYAKPVAASLAVLGITAKAIKHLASWQESVQRANDLAEKDAERSQKKWIERLEMDPLGDFGKAMFNDSMSLAS